jgi:UDP-sulfoquinovose synthase
VRVLIIGGDGYCGWPTALHFATLGYEVTILDNLIRRTWDRELGISSLTPIATLDQRLAAWHAAGGRKVASIECDVTDYEALCAAIAAVRPEGIVHFGQQRSAPFSMIDREHAITTLMNNTVGNMNLLWAMREIVPDAHLVKLGTMGEYGTPNIEIEEGFLTVKHKGRTDRLPFPKQPGSFYHLTKVSDSDHLFFACRVWGLRATDLNQGIVYGVDTDETAIAPELTNRFDYDGVYGTVLNRFCVQAALGENLSVYGRGGQTRTFINIRDTVRCIALALGTPAERGEFRVFNQFTEIFSVLELAHRVRDVAHRVGYDVEIDHVDNPRKERETHYYSSINDHLLRLGLAPYLMDDNVLLELIELARVNRDRVDLAQIPASVRWGDAVETAPLTTASSSASGD